MIEGKYSGNIITRTREYSQEDLAMIEKMRQEAALESTVTMERLLWMDDTFVQDASMYMECIWLWDGETKSGLMEEPHVHDFDEVIGFIGSDPDNPKELGAVMEIHLGDEVHNLTRSCLIYIPAGMKHCPLTFKKVERPVFFFTLAPTGNYGRTSGIKNPEEYKKAAFTIPEPDETGTRYARYIITEPKRHAPSGSDPNATPPPPPGDAKTTHMVSLDSEAIPGAFYVDFVWIWSGTMIMAPEPHAHDFDEMIGVVSLGSKEDPRNIDGNVSINIDGEKHRLTQSSLAYVPSNLPHCPIEFKEIKNPVLVFTIGNTKMWDITKK